MAMIGLACDPEEIPIEIHNPLVEPVGIRILGSEGNFLRVATEKRPIFGDKVVVESRMQATILLDTVGGHPQYTIAVEYLEEGRIIRHTFTREELDQRDWQLVITETGIE